MDGLRTEDADGGGTQERYGSVAYDTALSTLLAVAVYVVVKGSVDGLRQWRARISLLVVGSGPVGLTAALVAVRSGKVLKLTVLDERTRSALLCRPQQIALDPRSVRFLLSLGVDFDNMEGCWHNEHFFTRIGVFQEYLLSVLEQKKQKVDVRIHLGTKVSERVHSHNSLPYHLGGVARFEHNYTEQVCRRTWIYQGPTRALVSKHFQEKLYIPNEIRLEFLEQLKYVLEYSVFIL